MTPEQWEEVKERFHEALEKPAETRQRFLAHACSVEAVRKEVERLLAEHADAVNFLSEPAALPTAVSLRDDPDVREDLVGRKLAHYTITGKLGEGGMGVVYEAMDSRLDRRVALKLLPHDVVSDPARRRRFAQEARAASSLNHPNIVTIHDIAAADGVDYIAMELIRGRTLEETLSRGRLPMSQALKLGIQIADALAAAHVAGIVHRDLKPGNIMLDERGNVKVLDFGLAKLTDLIEIAGSDETLAQQAITEKGMIVGSAPYMSPEQAEGRTVDARSDIFSFGSVFYEMLTGTRAFRGASRTATMAAVLKDEPEPLTKMVPDLPRELERTVARCLRKDLDMRSQSMAEVRVALQELKEESDSGTPLRPEPGSKKRPLWPYTMGALVLSAAIAADLYFHAVTAREPLRARVLTSFVGAQSSPSLSPDGKQFAFDWDGDVPGGKTHIYIGLVQGGTPLRLTPEDQECAGPSWSPDGQSIAFYSVIDSSNVALKVMSALGGPARKVAQGRISGLPASWSPDSKWLTWDQSDNPERTGSGLVSIMVTLASGGEPRKLVDSSMAKGDQFPAFSPDGRQVAFIRIFADYDVDLYTVGFNDGRATSVPRRLTYDHQSKGGPIWTNNGEQIAYIADEVYGETSILRIPVSGGKPQRIEGIGADATWLTFSRQANRLLYSTYSQNFDIRRIDLKASQPSDPERFLSSTRYEASPAYSPDGARIAFDSNRGGLRQIWVADSNGANPVPLTSFTSGVAGSSRWSPDGQFIAFDARPGGDADIFTVAAAGGPVKKLTDFPGEDHDPSWSPDGKWIYFGTRRTGAHEIFRMHPDGSSIQQMTHGGGVFGMVTLDGKWLYYSKPGDGLRRMPADGGPSTNVLPPEALYKTISFTIDSKGIYACGKAKKGLYPLVFYPFAGGQARTIASLKQPIENYPGVSPDGRYLVYSSPDEPRYGIMLVDSFR